jgi:hypothetical protein
LTRGESSEEVVTDEWCFLLNYCQLRLRCELGPAYCPANFKRPAGFLRIGKQLMMEE